VKNYRFLLTHPAGWLATGFGAGLSPIAPGTVGSAAALMPWFFLCDLSWPIYLLIISLAFLVGVWASGVIIQRTGIDDPGVIVWDEFVGQWMALAFIPRTGYWVLAGFCLFRLFDIWKPWPVSWADRSIKGGLGVMLDDIIAGFYAACVLQGFCFFLPE